jgi:hypothetical protein
VVISTASSVSCRKMLSRGRIDMPISFPMGRTVWLSS